GGSSGSCFAGRRAAGGNLAVWGNGKREMEVARKNESESGTVGASSSQGRITAVAPQEPVVNLLPYQRCWVVDESPLKIVTKGRQIGFSFAATIRAVFKCLETENHLGAAFIGRTAVASADGKSAGAHPIARDCGASFRIEFFRGHKPQTARN